MVDPGAIFSLLTNVIELSKKSEEYNEELKELHQNSEILLSLIQQLEPTKMLSDSIKEDVIKDLDEAKILLESPEITKISQKLMIGFMAILPNNKTKQIKEKNEKIYRHIHRIKALIDAGMARNTLTTSVMLMSKSSSNPDQILNKKPENDKNDEVLKESHVLKRTKTETLHEFCFEATINENLVTPTLIQKDLDGELAYEISWEGDKTIFEQYLISNKDFNISETLEFKKVKNLLVKDEECNMKEIYSVGRGKFMLLIKDKSENVKSFLNLISGNHLKLFLQKIKVKISENSKEIIEQNKEPAGTMFFTCNDAEGSSFEENKKDEEKNCHFDFEFYVQDNSTNGSYILKKKKAGKAEGWERLPSKQFQLLENGDKVGIVMDLKTHQTLLLGFMFRKIEF